MIKRSLVCVLAAGALLLGVGIVRTALLAAPKVSVSLAAGPATFTGYCPVQIDFQIAFKVSGPCTISYHLVDSNGVKTETGTLSCKAAGTFYAIRTRSLSGSFSGWAAVQVTSPVTVQSNQVALKINCLPKPNLSTVRLSYDGPSPEMDIGGTHFGAQQGSKTVKIDGTPISAKPGWGILYWSDTAVSLKTSGIVPWEKTYKISIAEGNKTISNIFTARFKYTIDRVTPSSGPIAQIIEIYIWSLPSPQGDYKLDLWRENMGYLNLIVLSWGNPVKAKLEYSQSVPLPPALPMFVRLKKGADVVSNLVSYTIHH